MKRSQINDSMRSAHELVGEVYTVIYDDRCNFPRDPNGRFMMIDGDKASMHMLASNYTAWFA